MNVDGRGIDVMTDTLLQAICDKLDLLLPMVGILATPNRIDAVIIAIYVIAVTNIVLVFCAMSRVFRP